MAGLIEMGMEGWGFGAVRRVSNVSRRWKAGVI